MRIAFLIALLIGTVTAAAACPGHGRSTSLRPCFANQKTIAGAIEMWNLDANCDFEEHLARGHDFRRTFGPAPVQGSPKCTFPHSPRDKQPAPRVLPMTAEAFAVLKEFGYLQSVPQDPYQGPGTEDHYALTTFGNGVFCFHHGRILRPPNVPREQLVADGVTDPAMLARANGDDPGRTRVSDDPFAIVLGLLVLGGALWGLGRARFDPALTGVMLAREGAAGVARWMAVTFVLGAVGLVPLGLLTLAAVIVHVGTVAGAILLGAFRIALGLAGVERATAPAPRRTPPAPRPLADPAGLRCAVCSSNDGPRGWVTCPACDAAHHRECWTFQDGCAAFGCAMAHGRWKTGKALPVRPPARTQPAKPRPPVAVNWVS